jgi:hypothetical protein
MALYHSCVAAAHAMCAHVGWSVQEVSIVDHKVTHVPATMYMPHAQRCNTTTSLSGSNYIPLIITIIIII